MNSAGLDGIFYGGGTDLLSKQALGVGLVFAYSFVATLIIGYLIEKPLDSAYKVKRSSLVWIKPNMLKAPMK